MDILIITAHPDDEIIWFGSTISELSKIPGININIICLWGILEPPGSMNSVVPGFKDIDRKNQFYEVCNNLNVKKSYIITTDIDSVVFKGINQNYENILHEFIKVKNIIELKNIDLIISHSSYGDEKKHAGHVITHKFSKKYSQDNNIPFGWFSILPVPFNHLSILKNMYRINELHITNYSKCSSNLFYIQFQGNLKKKIELFNLYKAVDVESHINDIGGTTLICEGLYIDNDGRLLIEKHLISKMNILSNIF